MENFKKELFNYLDEIHHNRDYYSRSKIIELIKEFVNNSLPQAETPSVGSNEDDKEDLCQCRIPHLAYLASNSCKRCRKHTY